MPKEDPILDRIVLSFTEKGDHATVRTLNQGTLITASAGAPDDGSFPSVGALAMDTFGNLYGTTGGYNSGTIYELSPQFDGHWKETILYRFHAGSDGNGPGAGVVMDTAGNLYGTTVYGGSQC
jgi:hypothetical protein